MDARHTPNTKYLCSSAAVGAGSSHHLSMFTALPCAFTVVDITLPASFPSPSPARPPARPPKTHSKAEWLLGYTHAQMSYHKALEVLGVSEAVVEEERARRLGELGLASWGTSRTRSDGGFGQEGDDLCGGFFAKRRRSASHDSASLGTTLPGEVAFAPTHVRIRMAINRVPLVNTSHGLV